MIEESNDKFEDFLRESFDEFESEPSNKIWQNIEKELPKSSSNWYRRGTFLLLLVLLISWTTWQLGREVKKSSNLSNAEKVNIGNTENAKSSEKISIKNTTKNEARVSNNNSNSEGIQPSKSREFVNESSLKVENINAHIREKVKDSEQYYDSNLNNESESKLSQISENKNAVSTSRNDENSDIQSKIVGIDKEFPRNKAKTLENAENITLETYSKSETEIIKKVERSDAEIIKSRNVVTENTVAKSTKIVINDDSKIPKKNIELLTSKQLALTSFFELPNVDFQYHLEPKNRKVSSNLPLKYSLGVSLFNSFQNTKILNFTELPIHNVYNPELMSGDRRGGVISLGVIKSNGNKGAYRVEISYLTMKEWVYFDMASNSFTTINNSSNSTEIIQNFDKIRENKSSNYLVFSLNKQIFLSNNQYPRYFVSIGGTEILPLGAGKMNTGLNVSVGSVHQVNKHFWLTFEPNFNYYLTNTMDSRNVLRIQPYTIGLKLNLIYGTGK